MFKKTITVTMLALSISTAYATNGPANNNNSPTTTNNYVDNNSGIQGVGLATSGSQSIGNSSSNIGNSSASNTATGGASNAQGGSSVQGQKQGQTQTSSSGGNTLSNGSNTASNAASGNATNVSVGGSTYESSRIPVSTAFSAPLTSGADTCSGSSSGGLQAPGFGISFGSTWTDDNCVRLKNAKMMDGLGMRDVAIAMMCSDPMVADAMKASGRECPAKSK